MNHTLKYRHFINLKMSIFFFQSKMAKSIRSKQMRKNRTEMRTKNSLHEQQRLERLSKKLSVENLKTVEPEVTEVEEEVMAVDAPTDLPETVRVGNKTIKLTNKLKLMNRNQLKKRIRSKSRSRK